MSKGRYRYGRPRATRAADGLDMATKSDFERGFDGKRNPYRPGTRQYDAWQQGHNERARLEEVEG